jgi:hypothetical protein
LVLSALVNNVKYKLPGNIKNINNNRVIKVNIVFKVKLESFKWLAMPLIMFIIFYKVF